jgi:hypothetical protein
MENYGLFIGGLSWVKQSWTIQDCSAIEFLEKHQRRNKENTKDT